MGRFAFFGYREWAFKILKGLEAQFPGRIDSFTVTPFTKPNGVLETCEYSEKRERERPIDQRHLESFPIRDYKALFFIGWSWMVPKELVDNISCICLHPAPLPRYRGGSPIQAQILAGEEASAISLFRMTMGLDDGPIYYQAPISFAGHLHEIFDRMSEVGTDLTAKLISAFDNNQVIEHPQIGRAFECKRRKPTDSQLTSEKLAAMTGHQLWDFLRCLEDPYPNAYFVGTDGASVLLKWAELTPAKGDNYVLTLEMISKSTGAELNNLINTHNPCLVGSDGNYIYLTKSELAQQ